MGHSFRMELRIIRQANTPILTMTAAIWHFGRIGMHLGKVQRSRWYCRTTWNISVPGLCRTCCQQLLMLQWWPRWAILRAASSASRIKRPVLPPVPMPVSFFNLCTQPFHIQWNQQGNNYTLYISVKCTRQTCEPRNQGMCSMHPGQCQIFEKYWVFVVSVVVYLRNHTLTE